MESTLEKTAVRYQIALEREQRGVSIVSNPLMLPAEQTGWDNARLPVHIGIVQKEDTSHDFIKVLYNLWTNISNFSTARVDEQRLTTRDPWLAVYSTRKDF
jgi:hypothetical protein